MLESGDDDVPEPARLQRWAQAAYLKQTPAIVSLYITSSDEIQQINKQYRNKDKPTNVLSFPAGQVTGLPEAESMPIGDIVVCADVVSNEAAEQGKASPDHWAHMLVHGTLHLLGFDHEADAEAAAMETLESRILAEQGVADPYGAADDNC